MKVVIGGNVPTRALDVLSWNEPVRADANRCCMQNVDEQLRLPAPAPRPLGIAFDGQHVWVSSLETQRLYAMDPAQWTLADEIEAPGSPFGIVAVGDDLRVVLGQGEADDRSIMRCIPGHGFKEHGKIACPDATGSHLAYDGSSLYLSQFTKSCILVLDEQGASTRTIPLAHAPAALTYVDGHLYTIGVDDANDRRLLVRIDPRDGAQAEELAVIPFAARGLAYDGTRFWTSERDTNEIVAFARVK